MSELNEAKTATTATFVTALTFNAVVFGAELLAFTLLRPYFKAIYEPRTYVPPPSKRIQSISSSFLAWPLAVWNANYKDIIKANGMDAYFFVRFLRMMVKILLPIWLLSWAILLPTNSVRTRTGNSGNDKLARFTFGNISSTVQYRYAAHVIMVYIFTFWIFYVIKQEMGNFVLQRQKYLISPEHAKSVQANTLLITGVPERYLSKRILRRMFDELPGGVKKIWVNRDLKDLPDVYQRRVDASAKLESAETQLLKTATKMRVEVLKKEGKGKNSASKGSDLELGSENGHIPEVPKAQRPQHRLGFLGLFGEKVGTIEWARKEIQECTELLQVERQVLEDEDEADEGEIKSDERDEDAEVSATAKLREFGGKISRFKDVIIRKKAKDYKYPPLNSVFITFNRQIAAHLGAQVLTHHEPYRMSSRYIEISPEDVIWSNLNLNPYEIKVRIALSYAATAALIIFWAIPVSFVGAISNVSSLCTKVPWLSWICKLPDVVVGIISGILPPVLLAVLMMLLPIVLRLLAQLEGIPQRTGVELSLMSRFFIFQVIHSFLIVSLSSGIPVVIPKISNDLSLLPNLLAESLPLASTFFLTYMVLQGLTVTAGGFLQIVPLIIYYVKLVLLGSTPRAVYGIKYGARNVAWGTAFPGITLIVVIALGYSIISPIINGLACATFFAFYQLYKYLFLWQYQQSPSTDTGGLFFPKAIQHVFVGLYVQQVVLCTLFFLCKDEGGNQSAIPQAALMVVLIGLTAFFNVIINNSYGPLLTPLPLSLADRTYSAPIGNNNAPVERTSEEEQAYANERKVKNALVAEDVEAAAPENKAETGIIEVAGEEKDEAPPSLPPPVSEDEYGFVHPAVSHPQRTIWIPEDTLGLAEVEVRDCLKAFVFASTKDAKMDARGKVDISGPPPDLKYE